ncbi:MAG: hypothetical protein H7293_14335, partial [Candidatus Saccharibacteria bacterium]|nr:hypothetical protein [Rhodoferax sp.]
NQQARDVTAEFRKKLTGMQKLNPAAAGVVKSDTGTAAQIEGAKGN